MESLADFIVKLLDLFEAEFTEFREKIFKMLIAVGLFLLAVVLAITGFAMFVWGIYLGFSQLMPPFLAAFAVAMLAFIMGGGLLLCAKRKMA